MDYKNFKINANNLHTLAPKLLEELETGAFQHLLLKDDDMVTVIMKDLRGNEKSQEATIEKVREMLNNPKMNDIAISSMEMRFEFKKAW